MGWVGHEGVGWGGVGWVMKGWGGVGWVMKGWGGSCRGGVGWVKTQTQKIITQGFENSQMDIRGCV